MDMLFAIHYTGRPNAVTKADITALMTEFGKRGEVTARGRTKDELQWAQTDERDLPRQGK